MFKKLLKYDFKATRRFGIPITIGILVAGLVGSLDTIAMNALSDAEPENFFAVCGTIVGGLLLMLVYTVLTLGASAIQIVVMVDFYKNLGSDEGYLTFTLPVKSRDIILSKLTNCTIWSLIAGVATFISFIMMGVCESLSQSGADDMPGGTDIGLDFFGISGGSLTVFIILLIVFAIAYFFNSILLYFDAIFFGTVIAKKNKAVAAVGSVIIVNFIYGIVTGVVFAIAIISGASLASSTENPMVIVNIIIGIFTVLITALNVVFYEVLKHMMEKKLNLA